MVESLVGRWLSGNAPQRISGEEYARREALIYDATAPWLNGYPTALTDDYPSADAHVPGVAGPVPRLRNVQALMLVVVSQGVAVLTTLGAVAFAWRRRRDWSSARELATIGVVLLGFVAAMRVSGVAAEAYNQERAQIHAAAVLSVGFAAALTWFLGRWRRLSLVALSGALVVLFLASTGLAGRLAGGDPSANLADGGEARERFAVTDAEVATVEWLAVTREPGLARLHGPIRSAAGLGRGGPDRCVVAPGRPDTRDARPQRLRVRLRSERGGRARPRRDRPGFRRVRVSRGVPRFQQGRHLLHGLDPHLPVRTAMTATELADDLASSRHLTVSIVVISKDEPALATTLGALHPSLGDTFDEVVVVDASDGRLDSIRDAHPWVTWVPFLRSPGSGITIPEQRNAGVDAAVGDVIVFTDCGCVPEPEWLERLLQPILDDGEQVTCGRTGSLGTSVYDGIPAGSSIDAPPDYVDECPTINMAFRRREFIAVGGFDETFQYGSDIDFSWRMRRAGISIRYVPDAVVVHDWGDRARQTRRALQYGRARAHLYRKHPRRIPHMVRADPIVAAYPLFLLGLPLTLKSRWYPMLLAVPLWRNRHKQPVRGGGRSSVVRRRRTPGSRVGRRALAPGARRGTESKMIGRGAFPSGREAGRRTRPCRSPRVPAFTEPVPARIVRGDGFVGPTRRAIPRRTDAVADPESARPADTPRDRPGSRLSDPARALGLLVRPGLGEWPSLATPRRALVLRDPLGRIRIGVEDRVDRAQPRSSRTGLRRRRRRPSGAHRAL